MSKGIWKKGHRYKIFIYIGLGMSCLIFVLPLLLVVSISLSHETAIIGSGYSLFPRDFSLEAYKAVFADASQIIYSYQVTILQSILGTVLSLAVAGMAAYALSRTNFAYRKVISFVIFFTMLFGGGTISNYIIYTRYYGLYDSFWIYILPGITGGAWNTMMIRTFFMGLPESLFESARIDGAKELKIFAKIALPLSKPVFATVGFMTLVNKWNDWTTSMIYVRNNRLFTLQYLLQKILNEAEFLKQMRETNPAIVDLLEEGTAPLATLKYAMCVVAAGPMLMIFPLFQKYFEKGTVVGSVKG